MPEINIDRKDEHFVLISDGNNPALAQKSLAEVIDSMVTGRSFREGTADEIFGVYDAIGSCSDVATLLCRNLFISLGYNCSTRRVGDVYTRMDAIFSDETIKGPIEIELQSDTLSVVRNLLDDLAMFKHRFSEEIDNLTPVALCLFVPNTRQGFFQDCDDIKKVFGIEIKTVTLGALLVILWSGAKLNFPEGAFFLSFRDTSIKEDIDTIVGHSIPEDIHGAGLYDSAK